MALSKADYAARVAPSMRCAARCGNMYTASLYGGLASLLASVEPAALKGKRVSLYAFGSGCASSFFTLRVKGDTTEIREKMDLVKRLESMSVVPCEEFVAGLQVRSLARLCLFVSECSLVLWWTAARGEPQRCAILAQGLARQHLAGRVLPRGHRRQVPSQIRHRLDSSLHHPIPLHIASLVCMLRH